MGKRGYRCPEDQVRLEQIQAAHREAKASTEHLIRQTRCTQVRPIWVDPGGTVVQG
jgi:hypothetical protein